MMVKKLTLLFLLCCLFGHFLGATNIDSLTIIYEDENASMDDRISAAFSIAKTHRYKVGAKPYFQSALKWSRQLNDTKKEASSLWQLGIVYYNRAIYDTATTYYTDAFEKYESLELLTEQSTMLRNLGKIDSKQGRWPEAIVKYQKALSLSEKLKDTSGVATTYNLIGSIHRKQKNYDDALEYLNKALATAQTVNFIPTQVDALGNIATTYQELDSVDLAAEYFERTLDLSRTHKMSRRIAVCLMTLGQIHQLSGDYDRAKPYLEEAISLYTKLGNQRGTAPIKAALGQIEAASGDPDKAIGYCEEAYAMTQKSGNITSQKTCLDCLIRAYEAQGDFKKANGYFKKLDNLKTDFYKESNIQEVTELQMQAAFEKEKEIAALEQKQKDARQSWIRNGLIAGLFGLGLFAWLIYQSSQRRKKNNALLAEKNEIISKALSEKDLLLREIHHRVKNNLQVVSSLLSMQSRFVTEDSAQEAIKEGRNRVISMALIHQNLYQEDNLTGIDVKEYFQKLIRSLFNSYNIEKDRISLALDVMDINLDVDTVVPLGLIVNELVSNALKYAFEDGREGEIIISLSEPSDGLLQLSVSDNGIGFDAENIDLSTSFGYRMIEAFKDKLEGELEIDSEHGTTVVLKVKDYQIAS